MGILQPYKWPPVTFATSWTPTSNKSDLLPTSFQHLCQLHSLASADVAINECLAGCCASSTRWQRCRIATLPQGFESQQGRGWRCTAKSATVRNKQSTNPIYLLQSRAPLSNHQSARTLVLLFEAYPPSNTWADGNAIGQ